MNARFTRTIQLGRYQILFFQFAEGTRSPIGQLRYSALLIRDLQSSKQTGNDGLLKAKHSKKVPLASPMAEMNAMKVKILTVGKH